MKHSLAWIAAECATLLLTIGAAAMTLAALLNLLEINSIFTTWFETSYMPALLALVLVGLRFLSQIAASHSLDRCDDEAVEVER